MKRDLTLTASGFKMDSVAQEDIALRSANTETKNSARYKALRIDQVPDPKDGDSDESDEFIGRTSYRREKSPVTLDKHLLNDDDNLIHFKAMIKYYGVNESIINIPEIATNAT